MSFFSKLKNKILGREEVNVFSSSNKEFKNKLSQLREGYKKVDEEFLEEILIILLESDMGYQTAERVVKLLDKKCRQYHYLKFDYVVDFLFEIMADIYGEEIPEFQLIDSEVNVILMVGVNGSGKTTTCGKLIKKYQDEGKTVAVVAADTFRAGAIEQLARWAQRFDVHCIKGRENGDPSAAIVDGCRFAKDNNIDVLICDTAGRLQNKTNLMAELSKMYKVIEKELPSVNKHVYLVIDSTTGQNGLNQAKVFFEATNVDGIILTKMDGTAKGGIVLAIKDIYKIPVSYVGLGESAEDLKRFEINAYLYGLAEGVYNVEED